jgi:hypothetical protein
MAGFGLRVSKGGERAWVYNVTVAGTGQQVQKTLGRLSLIPKLTVARDMARAEMLKAQRHQPGRGAAAAGSAFEGRDGSELDDLRPVGRRLSRTPCRGQQQARHKSNPISDTPH